MPSSNEAHDRKKGKIGGPKGMAVAEKAKDFKGATKRLFNELGKYRILIVISVILALLGAVLSISAPNKLSEMTDEISKGLMINTENISEEDQLKYIQIISTAENKQDLYCIYDELPESIKKIIEPKMNMENIKRIGIILVAIYICSAVFNYIQSIIMTNVSNKFARDLRSRISVKINKLPLKYFDRNQTGDILSRVTNDIDTIAQTMNQSLATLVTSVTLFLGSLVMMFWTNWVMAVTAIVSSSFGFIGMAFILKNSQKYFTARQVELGKLNAHIEEVFLV